MFMINSEAGFLGYILEEDSEQRWQDALSRTKSKRSPSAGSMYIHLTSAFTAYKERSPSWGVVILSTVL